MTTPEAFADYLAPLPDDQRAVLEDLSRRITALLPGGAEPVISYAMPGWRVPVLAQPKKTKVAAGMAAFAVHLGFYPHSGSVIPQIAARLADEGFKTSKSGIQFTPSRPIPDWALKAAIHLRLAEIG